MYLIVAGTAWAQLPPVPYPPENPFSEEKRVLGKILFWDEQLSSDDTVACGTCHRTGASGTDTRIATNPGPDLLFGTDDDVLASPGIAHLDAGGHPVDDPLYGFGPQVTRRATNAAVDAAFAPELFWDGHAPGTFVDPQTATVSIAAGGALESQLVFPIVGSVEMAHADRSWEQVVQKLASALPLANATDLPADAAAALAVDGSYPALFQRAFGSPAITSERIAYAIATYERTLIADQTPWDDYIAGNGSALTADQEIGWLLFQGLPCSTCHLPPAFTDHSYRNIGLRPPTDDPGRQLVTGDPADRGRFKVPGLRNVGLKVTFMHNGRLSTMNEAVSWYLPTNPDRFTDNIDPLVPVAFSGQQNVDRIVDFLANGLTDPRVAATTFPFDRPELHGGALPQLWFDADRATLHWPVLTGVLSYNVYRGDLADLQDGNADGLPDGGYGTCMTALDPDPTDGVFVDADPPGSPGEGFFYLKSVVDSQGERGLGTTASGLSRELAWTSCP